MVPGSRDAERSPPIPTEGPTHAQYRIPALLPLTVAAMVTFAVLFAVTPTSAVDTELNIGNAAPLVDDLTLADTEIAPSAGAAKSVSSTILVSDVNGCNDIEHVNVSVLKPDGSVHIATGAATYQSCSAGTIATYTHSFDMNHYDAPALGTDQYKVKVVATDSQGATGDNLLDLATFNYLELVAVNVPAAALDFGGPLNPGDSSGIVSLSVENQGNVAIDTELSGTDLDHATEPASIPVSATAYSVNSDMSGSADLTGTSTQLPMALAAGSSSSSSVYWRLTVPSGEDQWVPSGDYTGTLSISAIKS